MLVEGDLTKYFMQATFPEFNVDVSGKDVLEIGPKHGIHTRWISSQNPKSITCIELEHKLQLIQSWENQVPNLEIIYEDFLTWKTNKKFDVILFAGVIYHNTEQLRMLKKLKSLSKDKNTIMFFESSTVRIPELYDKNIIQVYWPERYNDLPTGLFWPSKKACISMLEMSGWEILKTSDEMQEPIKKDIRISILTQASGNTLETYPEINHLCVSD